MARERWCSGVRCMTYRPLAAFRLVTRRGRQEYQHRCMECHAAEQKARREANPEKSRIAVRRSMMKLLHGVTVEEYEKKFTEQKGLCACCGKPETLKTENGELRRLAVDHNHVTGENRGLLCSLCNMFIVAVVEKYGHLLDLAKDYLRRHDGEL